MSGWKEWLGTGWDGQGRVGWPGLERAHLAQVKVCVAKEVWMVLPHQANHVVIQLVLFKHGDGEIRLLHCHVQPADRKGALRLLLHILTAIPSRALTSRPLGTCPASPSPGPV